MIYYAKPPGFIDETDFYAQKTESNPFLAVIDEYTDVSGSQEYVRLEFEFAAIGTGSGSVLGLGHYHRKLYVPFQPLSKAATISRLTSAYPLQRV